MRPQDVARAVGEAGGIDVVINAAAYTAVDKAEAEEAVAQQINSETVGVLAEACARRDLPLIHVSTDYVFDGNKTTPYIESDATNPLNAYGRSKLGGERAIHSSGVRHVILRTSWIYSAFGANFVKTMLRLGVERDELRVVDDQYGAPTAAGDLAAAIFCIAHSIVHARADAMFGTYHYTGGGVTTWHDFAATIMADAKWAGVRASVVPISTDEYPLPARRPKNSRLDCAKITRTFGITPVPLRAALEDVLGEIRRERGLV